MKYKIIVLMILAVSLTYAQGRHGGGRMSTWDESLNLTTEQMQQITQMREAMQPGMQEARKTLGSLVQELRDLKRSDNADAEQIAELEAMIEDHKSAIESMMVAHRAAIRTLLTEEQQLIFDQHEFGPREDRGPRRGMRRGGDPNQEDRPRPGNRRW